jgi:hypothetical protein
VGWIGRTAAALDLASGAGGVLLGWVFPPFYACPSGGCPFSAELMAIPYLGALLVVDSLVCFAGVRAGFVAGGALSLLVAGAVVLGPGIGYTSWLLLAAVSLIALAADAVAYASRKQIAEQAHPLNLPVFG